ncbi:MAG: PAS domain S-box protein [Phycisphaerae bacterium]
MIPETVILALDAAAAAAALVALVGLLGGRGRLGGTPRGLLTGITALALAWCVGNLLEWSGVFPPADIAEDFLNPLVPVLWLFLFILMPEQQARRRLRRSVDRLGALHRLAVNLTAATSPQAIMNDVVAQALRLLDLPVVVILTPEVPGGRLLARASFGVNAKDAEALTRTDDRDLAAEAVHVRAPVQAALSAEDVPPEAAFLVQRRGLTNLVAVPLLTKEEAVGVLMAGRTEGRRFEDDEIRLLQTLCAHAAGAIQNARLLARVTESEAKYRAIVENARAAIIVVDAYRHVLFWNRGAERLFGWKAEEVEGHHVEFIYPPDRRAEVVSHILPDLQRHRAWAGEFPCLRKNGETFTAFLNLSRVFDASGSVICTLGILSDVTERVRLREQLFQAQKMETLGTLAGGIAHDFNNLLSAILGATGLLRTHLPENSEDYDSVVTIEKAARRGAQLVDQLMDLSRREPARNEAVDLNRVVRDSVDLLRRTFPGGIEVVTRLAPHLRTVRGDPGQLQQVLMNLGINAREAMDEHGTLTITTENLPAHGGGPFDDAGGPGVALIVSDTGCGIPLREQQRVFEPLVTTKGNEGGTGLGLSTAYAIVNRHGGHIDLESAPGQGATFHIVLPAA